MTGHEGHTGDSAVKIEFDRLHREGGAFLSAAQLTRMPMIVTDASGEHDHILFANPAFLAFFGYAESDVVGHEIEDLCDAPSRQVVAELRRNVAEGQEMPMDIALRRKDGSATLTSAMMFSIADNEGVAAHHFLSFIDRAELAAADAKVQELMIENARLVRELAQRDLLVAETNHRVKNALMQAGMVLMMQGAGSRNPEVSDALAYAQARLETMAGIYDLLSTNDATTIDLSAFLQSIAPNWVPPSMPVVVETTLEPGIVLSPDIAQPLALIAMELVTNAVKHAFPRRRAGRVHVRLARRDRGLDLKVADDGVGMPSVVTDSLGYKLVRALLRQVGGTLDIAGARPGTAVTVSVPVG